MKRAIIKNSDGTVSVLIPAGRGLSIEQIAEKDCGGLPYEIVDTATIPIDRTFRNAWKYNGVNVETDMVKARDIWRNKMRVVRAPLLSALDVQYTMADEAGDIAKKTQIAAQKQALRDVTADPAIGTATTPDALKAVWPAILNG